MAWRLLLPCYRARQLPTSLPAACRVCSPPPHRSCLRAIATTRAGSWTRASPASIAWPEPSGSSNSPSRAVSRAFSTSAYWTLMGACGRASGVRWPVGFVVLGPRALSCRDHGRGARAARIARLLAGFSVRPSAGVRVGQSAPGRGTGGSRSCVLHGVGLGSSGYRPEDRARVLASQGQGIENQDHRTAEGLSRGELRRHERRRNRWQP